MPRVPVPRSRRSTVVAGVAVVTMVASMGATVTGAVRPARSRAGRFYRAPSGISLTAPRAFTSWSTETTMFDALQIVRAARPAADEDAGVVAEAPELFDVEARAGDVRRR